MRVWPGTKLLAVVVFALAAPASGEPEPKTIDSKAFRDHLIVLRDDRGGTYVVLRDGDTQRAWYGTGKSVYEQVIVGSSSDGSTGMWELDIWVPHVSGIRPGTIRHNPDNTFTRDCTPDDNDASLLKLTQMPADQAKHTLDKTPLMTSAIIRKSHLFARDETGVYYYVDELRKQYGEGNYRVFVGKKGGMRQLPLTDIATDSGGEIFATKSGDLRMVYDREAGNGKPAITWVQGDKRTTLTLLDPDMNSNVIYRGLGVYTAVGTICDDM